ncbi:MULTISPECIES: alpha/beta fold hydrolase [Comamonadaceae]|jgi:pimeloyl-ACP methyl ester carboxylesterase|uniref:2-hydroxy-6-oxo-2,4-heptadienoate hydrolase n=2 Tax=Acidovorax carolinensis TaxID=553814 RepID=A0A240UAD0_9BURK|nr:MULTISPECIES: alpha/beta hydrolase [Comamonadaceae]ART37883.1 F490 [uncultured bacterium]ART47639.1 2-hydroxy-6-oxo-2,4-heptadienoate hydrolase [Acidovorax carolinensis]ART51197.1 2-hydroxy-6-oxo-2,4-heptadienoate hydrolase [Acidovorax carolinensis]ART55682.1 2-hydroxy-6-oxo-2,4-heptadienoate hydrolase [Acidovorax carolinensis]ART58454.1 2-hydroxy-6-oxo-2,4-heptadienoate hydrolase [Acidovorax carolinensis]
MTQNNNPEIGHSVEAAGIRTNYLEAGSGAPLVLLHGSGPGVTAWANWRLAIPEFAKTHRVLAPDLAGFGYTERKAGVVYNLDYWVRHIIGFLDALKIEQADFVGNSFGGALTLAVATRHPDRVRKVVLMGSAGTEFTLTHELDAVWGYEPSVENMRTIVQMFAYDKSLLTEALVASRYDASIRPGFHESYSSLFPAPRQRHIAALATPEDKLRALDKPVLLVHGREDRVIPLDSSLRLHQLLQRSELHVFGQCGHWTQIEKKDRFVGVVENFLAAA